jgi:single-strand DNA-binding protein
MNEITIHGNLTANPVVNTNPNTGRSATTFDLALNSRYFDRGNGQWRDRPAVFHKVVCFGDLAANAAETLRKGMTVTVTGTLADDSYTPNGADKPIRRTRLEAADVAVSLRWAVAAVARQTTPTEQRPEPAQLLAATASNGEPAQDADTPAETPARVSSRRTARRTEPEPVAAA